MGKMIAGSLMFVGGLFLCFTGIGLIIGIPLLVGGLGMGIAGMGSLTKTAVKTGVVAGKAVGEMRKASAERAALEAEERALADARARVEAERRALRDAGGSPDTVTQSLGRPTP